jgi:hypothetical protein
MTLGQIVDGNTGISIESSIAQGRFQEMYDNFKKIADAPDSQLDTQEKRDAKEVAQVLLPKMERIKNTFEKNYKNTNYNKDYDLGIASALTEYQFLNEEFDNRISEYNSKITELRNDVPVSSPEAKTVGEYKIKIKGLEKAKEQIKEELQKHNEFVESQDKTNLTKDQLGYSLYLEKEIEEINEDITFAKNAIKQAKESSEDTQLDMFADAYAEANEQLFELEASKKAFENLKERYADKYAKLQTKEGKDEYIASIKKADKKRQENAEKAAIANAKTEEQLESVEEVVETPAGKLAAREKESEIIAEEIAKQELPEDSPVEAVQEKVTSNKTKSEIQKRLKEIEKQSKLSPAAIANLYADNKIPVQFQRQASTPEVQALIDEHLELQKELKSLDATSSNTKVEKQQAETVENIDKGIIEPVVIETIEDEGEQLPTSSFKIGDKVMSNADKTRGMKGVVEGFTKDNRVTVRLENNTAPSFSPQSLIPIAEPVVEQPKQPVTKEKPTLKTIESKPIRSTQESNTDRTDTVRFPLQFKIENEKITLEPSFAQRDNPDLKNEYVASYAVQSGDSVRLELAGDRTKYKPAKEEDAVIYIVHEKLNKVIATLPSSTDKELRKEIYTILKEGNEVKTTISSNSESQIIGSSNVNNVIIDGKYYNVPLNDLENIFNHRGKIGFPITLAFVEGNEFSDADRKLAIPDKVKEQLTEYYIKDYLDNTKDATQEDAESFASDMIFQMENDISDVKLSITRNENELVLAGLPYIVVPGPNGRFKALRLENRKLLPTHVNFIIEKLKEEQNTADAVQVVNDVVYTNSDVENHFKESPSKRTPEEHEAKRKRHFRARNIESDIIIEFYSETLDAIIITTNKKLAENEYKIIQDASYTEDNKVKSVYVAGKKDLNLEQELKNALENKFFNIEKDKLTTESYTSQVTGFAYDSYFDYLTSPKELKANNFAKNNLAKSILSTTIKPVNGTPFHNVAVIYDSITYTNRDIVVDKVTETPINTKVIKEKAKVKPEIKVKPEQVTTLKNITTEVKDVREKIKERRKASINQAQETKKNCKG